MRKFKFLLNFMICISLSLSSYAIKTDTSEENKINFVRLKSHSAHTAGLCAAFAFYNAQIFNSFSHQEWEKNLLSEVTKELIEKMIVTKQLEAKEEECTEKKPALKGLNGFDLMEENYLWIMKWNKSKDKKLNPVMAFFDILFPTKPMNNLDYWYPKVKDNRADPRWRFRNKITSKEVFEVMVKVTIESVDYKHWLAIALEHDDTKEGYVRLTFADSIPDSIAIPNNISIKNYKEQLIAFVKDIRGY